MDKVLLDIEIEENISVKIVYHFEGKMKNKITACVFAGYSGWAGPYSENPQTLLEVLDIEIKKIKEKLTGKTTGKKSLKKLLKALIIERAKEAQLSLF